MTQVLSSCRWVPNDQVYAYTETIDSRVPDKFAALPTWDQKVCLPSFVTPYGHPSHGTLITSCKAGLTKGTCEATTNSGTNGQWRKRQQVEVYENMVKADSLTSGTSIASSTCGDTTETVTALLPDMWDANIACALVCSRNLYDT